MCEVIGLEKPWTPCPPGYFCSKGANSIRPRLNTANKCPNNSYCPQSSDKATPCPEGTYSARKGLWLLDQCAKCRVGLVCKKGASAPSRCQPGYFCRPEEPQAPCPAGHYCNGISKIPLKCPKGTFSNKTSLNAKENCTDCPKGRFCSAEGLTKDEVRLLF